VIDSGAVLTPCSATIPVEDAIEAGDALSIIFAGVTDPPAAGIIDDFDVATTSDPVPAPAARYSILANASAGWSSPSTRARLGSWPPTRSPTSTPQRP